MENQEFTLTDDLLASKSQRLLNFIVDMLIVYSITIGVSTTLILIAGITNSPDLSESVESMGTFKQILFGGIILILYYSLTEIYFSRTFAKYFTKTLVVIKDGSKPTGKSIFRRTISRLIPFEFLTFLGARGWHDTISGTYVVKKHEFLEKKKMLNPSDTIVV